MVIADHPWHQISLITEKLSEDAEEFKTTAKDLEERKLPPSKVGQLRL